MARQTGDFLFSANFEVTKTGTIDARQLVDDFADLLNFTSANYIALGFPVAVAGLSTPSERGIYQCIDPTDLSNAASWEKISSSGGGGVTAGSGITNDAGVIGIGSSPGNGVQPGILTRQGGTTFRYEDSSVKLSLAPNTSPGSGDAQLILGVQNQVVVFNDSANQIVVYGPDPFVYFSAVIDANSPGGSLVTKTWVEAQITILANSINSPTLQSTITESPILTGSNTITSPAGSVFKVEVIGADTNPATSVLSMFNNFASLTTYANTGANYANVYSNSVGAYLEAGGTGGQNNISVRKTSMVVSDQLNSKGLTYSQDYSTAGEADNLWIPSWGSVKAYADAATIGTLNQVLSQGSISSGTGDISIEVIGGFTGANAGLLLGDIAQFVISQGTLGVDYYRSNYIASPQSINFYTTQDLGAGVKEAGFFLNQTTFEIKDTIFNKGIAYTGDYSTLGIQDDRWIPDYGTIKNRFISKAINTIEDSLFFITSKDRGVGEYEVGFGINDGNSNGGELLLNAKKADNSDGSVGLYIGGLEAGGSDNIVILDTRANPKGIQLSGLTSPQIEALPVDSYITKGYVDNKFTDYSALDNNNIFTGTNYFGTLSLIANGDTNSQLIGFSGSNSGGLISIEQSSATPNSSSSTKGQLYIKAGNLYYRFSNNAEIQLN